MRILRARLLQIEQEQQHAEVSAARREQVKGGGRSEKIRTYNYKENRVTDHRIGFTLHSLDRVLDGELDEIVDALAADERGAPTRRRVTRRRPTTLARRRAPRSRARLAAAGIVPAEAEARFLVEEASGYDAAEWPTIADAAPARAPRARLRPLVERRVAGEPLQYVLGAWSFRGLDLMVDRRVLIPRPETEQVVEVALEEAERLGLRRSRRRRLVARRRRADGGGRRPRHRFGRDRARARGRAPRRRGVGDRRERRRARGRAAPTSPGARRPRVRIAAPARGSTRCPAELRGELELVVSNPPYVAEHEVAELPDEVAGYEPRGALVVGPDRDRGARGPARARAASGCAPGGALVCELAPHQADAMVERARALGYAEAFVRDDLAGRPRVLVARAG